MLHLRQLAVLVGQRVHRVVEHLHHKLLLVLVVEVQLGELQRQRLALIPRLSDGGSLSRRKNQPVTNPRGGGEGWSLQGLM